jgi:hypothetical protein
MSKTRRNINDNKRNQNKRNQNKRNHNKRNHNKTIKNHRLVIAKSFTPNKIRKISNKIANKLSINKESYSPTINKNLVTLQSIPRNELSDCNTEKAFKLESPLEIGIPGKSCFKYDTTEAKSFLLRNLAANKHIDPKKIVPPIQAQANCWFNAMFVTFFVSDKGRKFFHFLRQLMIEGKNKNGEIIPKNLRDAFALLNFGIDSCLTGNKFAYELNTNNIIHKIYESISSSYKLRYPDIIDVDKAGNPLMYYISIINYLNDNSIQLLFIRDVDSKWKEKVAEAVKKTTHLPHIIVLEVFDEMAGEFNNKPKKFAIKEAKYEIDSAVIRDISKQHFCSTITCEDNEMGYDGMSFHRIVPLKWKNKINQDFNWQFEGTTDYDGTPLEWNFTKSYQLLMYYRVI